MLKENRKLKKKDTIKLPFLQNDLDLIYHVDILKKKRLCVPKSIISEILIIGHGQSHHEFQRVYDYVSNY